jgi:hypothetical protein
MIEKSDSRKRVQKADDSFTFLRFLYLFAAILTVAFWVSDFELGHTLNY